MTVFKTVVRQIDECIGQLTSGLSSGRQCLLVFLFHSLFRDDEVTSGVIDPQQGITIRMFRSFVSHFHGLGYTFVSPADILRGLDPAGKYVWITFDDGYYNNQRALPVMEEFKAPATFFISTRHVQEQVPFWWDVVYRELSRRGHESSQIQARILDYKRLQPAAIQQALVSEFGEESIRVMSDLDRAFTAAELAEFADHPLVSIGNHTRNHAILAGCELATIEEQIRGAQDDLCRITGRTPVAIAYPNGNCSTEVLNISLQAGLRLGVIVSPGRNRVPLGPSAQREMLLLKRFTLWGNRRISAQCESARSMLSLERTVKGLRTSTT